MIQKLLALYGIKWNPFLPDIPVDSLWRPQKIEQFCWRMETQVRQGGFALITGDPGTGKSVALRLLAHHLAALPDVLVAALTRPQSALSDFYRELGSLCGIPLIPHNRWAGFAALRQKWITHVEATHLRPVLLLDEAQEIPPPVLAELRILASTDFDSRSILTLLLCGDSRLTQQFRKDDMLPIASRIRTRLTLEYLTPPELLDWLRHSLAEAGNPNLMTPELQTTLAEHAAGNLRVLATMANEMLTTAARRELPQLDEKLYLELFTPQPRQKTRTAPTSSLARA